jgi:hypothetical protein
MAIAHCLVLKIKTSHSKDRAERRSWAENKAKRTSEMTRHDQNPIEL